MSPVFRVAVIAVTAVAAGASPSSGDTPSFISQGADAVNAAVAKGDKNAAVKKVLDLMEGLRTKILADGEKEAHSYDKFACFCKDTTAEKQAAIAKAEDEKDELMASIEELTSMREDLDEEIKKLLKTIADKEEALKKANEKRAKEKATYETNEADMISALQALDAAIASLKSSKAAASFVQIQGMARTLRKALDMADALGFAGATKATRTVASLLQQDPSVPMQDYDFHSDGIIGTLEKLKADFNAKKIERA